MSRPRPSQTLPIKKGEGVSFWQREGTLAIGFKESSSEEESSSDGSASGDEYNANDDGDFDGIDGGGSRTGRSRMKSSRSRKSSKLGTARSKRSELGEAFKGEDGELYYVDYSGGDGSEDERNFDVISPGGVMNENDDGERKNGDVYEDELPVRTAGRPGTRSSRWREQFGQGIETLKSLKSMVPNVPSIPLGKLMPWRADSDDAENADDGWSVESDDSETKKLGPPFPGAERFWFYDNAEDWHAQSTRGKISRVLCCKRCFPTTPAIVERFWARWDTRHLRAEAKSEERQKIWRVRTSISIPRVFDFECSAWWPWVPKSDSAYEAALLLCFCDCNCDWTVTVTA